MHEVDTLIERATSESIPNGEVDLPVALEVSDLIRSRRISPRDSMRALKKRIMMTKSNPNAQLASWRLTDVCIKNGGTPLIKEICSREFMSTMEQAILKSGDSYDESELHHLVKTIFFQLYLAFKDDSQLGYLREIYDKLAHRGVKFSDNVVTNPEAIAAMLDSKTPAEWVDSDTCMICSKKFSLINRRHHCRSCGGIFCQDHSSKSIELPDLGIHEPVRVCDNCYDDYDYKKGKNIAVKKDKKKKKSSKSSSKYDEEEQLRKAIELSLKESRNTHNIMAEPNIPVIESHIEQQNIDMVNEEQDPDLRAAIQESLRVAEQDKLRRQNEQLAKQEMTKNHDTSLHDLQSSEEANIYLFASLVEKMKGKSPTEILQDTQLQNIYQLVCQTKPKLNVLLNERIRQYNDIIAMNGEISEVVNLYDNILEKQLREISVSQQYQVPISSNEIYSSYDTQSYGTKNARTSKYAPQIYSSQLKPEDRQPQLAPRSSNDNIAPKTNQMTANNNHSTIFNHNTDLPTEKEDFQTHSQLDFASDPPYPQEDGSHTALATQHYDSKTSILNSVPYPVEHEENLTDNTSIKNSAHHEDSSKITNYDFPTVPMNKVATPIPIDNEPINSKLETEAEEENLLIEL